MWAVCVCDPCVLGTLALCNRARDVEPPLLEWLAELHMVTVCNAGGRIHCDDCVTIFTRGHPNWKVCHEQLALDATDMPAVGMRCGRRDQCRHYHEATTRARAPLHEAANGGPAGCRIMQCPRKNARCWGRLAVLLLRPQGSATAIIARTAHSRSHLQLSQSLPLTTRAT